MDKAGLELRPVGYFPKNTAVPADWNVNERVKEICSVSDCVSSSPPGWIDHWLHNDWGFFNSAEDARRVVPSGSTGFSLFAYRLLTVRFVHGEAEPLNMEDPATQPIDASYISLGFDAVSKSVSSFFECSPLSCNSMASEVPVNEFCLIDGLEQAISLAERFSREEPEAGPYYILEVLRAAQA
jgi:hypothetical protein